MDSIVFTANLAHLSPVTAVSFRVRPLPAHDLPSYDGMESLHWADWAHVVANLEEMGWELTQGEDGGVSPDGQHPDGRGASTWRSVSRSPRSPCLPRWSKRMMSGAGMSGRFLSLPEPNADEAPHWRLLRRSRSPFTGASARESAAWRVRRFPRSAPRRSQVAGQWSDNVEHVAPGARAPSCGPCSCGAEPE